MPLRLCFLHLLLCVLIRETKTSITPGPDQLPKMINCTKSLDVPRSLTGEEREQVYEAFSNYSRNPHMRYRCYRELLASAFLYRDSATFEKIKGPRSVRIRTFSEEISQTTALELAKEAAKEWKLNQIYVTDFGCNYKIDPGNNHKSNVTFVCIF